MTQADELRDKDAAKQLAASVMVRVAKGQTEQGLMLIKPYTLIPDHQFDGMMDSYRMQAPVIEQKFGKTIGVELALVEEVGESLMLVAYIQKFEKHLMRWKFYFYKPYDVWTLNTFSNDDKIQLMFSKMY